MSHHRTHVSYDEKDWERILWRRLPYPDNYVPPSHFLASLRKNANFTPYTYSPLALASTSVCQHVANIFTFLSIFMSLKDKTRDPRLVVWLAISLFAIGYAAWEVISYFQKIPIDREARSRAMRSAILVFLALLALAPVLKTLTEATSSDSIWALAFVLFTLHTILADYTTPLSHWRQERLTSVLSMNAAISASVVLASRLDSDLAVFALVLFSVQTFALFPLLRRHLSRSSPTARIAITAILSMVSVGSMGLHSRIGAWIVLAILSFVTFASPAILVWAQRYKNEIRGEWDVAVPQVGQSGDAI